MSLTELLAQQPAIAELTDFMVGQFSSLTKDDLQKVQNYLLANSSLDERLMFMVDIFGRCSVLDAIPRGVKLLKAWKTENGNGPFSAKLRQDIQAYKAALADNEPWALDLKGRLKNFEF